ncbi:MAG: acyl--CoA ligase [Bauldia sp.]|nr:acyl--CoA ligase [Bauldia sp.]
MAEVVSRRFDVACRNYPDRVAVFDGDGTPIPFERLYYSVHSIAQTLIDHGVRQKHVVALRVGGLSARLALSLAVLRIGSGLALFDHELPKAGGKNGVDHYIVDESTEVPSGLPVLRLDASWLRPIDRAVPQRGVGGIIVGTSGTTGTPKYQAMSEAVVLARQDLSSRVHGPQEGPTLIGFNPATSAGFRMSVAALTLGQTQIWQHSDPVKTLQAMNSVGVRNAQLPTYLLRLLLDAARRFEGPMPKLEQILVGGAILSPDLAAEAEEIFGCKVYTGYGSTESGGVCYFRITDAPEALGTVGKIPKQFNHKFLGENGEVAESGELYLQIPKEVRGSAYLNAPGPYDADGWLATGDIGFVGADGNLVLTGRRSEYINAGGTKRAPEYFEASLARLPGVQSVAAFALDNGWGSDDAGVALVANRERVSDEELREALSQGVPGGLVFRIFFVKEIPVSAAGKVSRKELADQYRDRTADLVVG